MFNLVLEDSLSSLCTYHAFHIFQSSSFNTAGLLRGDFLSWQWFLQNIQSLAFYLLLNFSPANSQWVLIVSHHSDAACRGHCCVISRGWMKARVLSQCVRSQPGRESSRVCNPHLDFILKNKTSEKPCALASLRNPLLVDKYSFWFLTQCETHNNCKTQFP